MSNTIGHAEYAFPLHISHDNSHKGELVSSKYISYWLNKCERKM